MFNMGEMGLHLRKRKEEWKKHITTCRFVLNDIQYMYTVYIYIIYIIHAYIYIIYI
jgi:hypothetical protein